MEVTEDVSQPLMAWSKALASLNIAYMVVAEAVSQPEMSWLKDEACHEWIREDENISTEPAQH